MLFLCHGLRKYKKINASPPTPKKTPRVMREVPAILLKAEPSSGKRPYDDLLYGGSPIIYGNALFSRGFWGLPIVLLLGILL